MRLSLRVGTLGMLAVILLLGGNATAARAVVINEIMARNAGTLTPATGALVDEDGEASDWIELYNPDPVPVDLSAWHLTDDPDDPNRWTLPAGTVLPAGGYLVVFASGKDRATPRLHANFKLDADGAYLALTDPAGHVIHAYDPAYPEQVTDLSYGLGAPEVSLVQTGSPVAYHVPTSADAGEDWQVLDYDDTGWSRSLGILGFSAQPVLSAQSVGWVATPGGFSEEGGVITVEGRGTNLAESEDSCTYLTVPLRGDGELSVRVLGVDEGFDGAQLGLMIRASLDADAPGLAEVLILGGGLETRVRTRRGASAQVVGLADIEAPLWLRLVRRGDTLESYYSRDGRGWIRHATDTVRMNRDVLMGLCVSARSSRGATRARFDHLSLGADESADLRERMLDTNASVWTRAVFQAEEVNDLSTLSLDLRYEDGFVAYLNGVEIARANAAGGAPRWDSRAASDRPASAGDTAQVFDVSAFREVLREGRNVLAVQGLNDDPADPHFLLVPQLTARGDRPRAQYLAVATPGAANSAGARHRLAPPRFSHSRGLYDQPLLLRLTSETPGAVIRYTTDGTAPGEVTGLVYTEPLLIDRSTCLRARTVKPGWVASDVRTHSFLFPEEVLSQPAAPPGFPASWGGKKADYAMDPEVVSDGRYRNELVADLRALPTLSLVLETDAMFGPQGIYSNPNGSGESWERPVSMELIDPGGADLQVDCGVRIYGGVGRREAKKTLRLLFKRRYGPTKLRWPLFGPEAVDRFDTIILRAGFNNSWHGVYNQGPQYIRDEWMRQTQLAMGHPSLHGTFVHLYINGLYWGLYNPVERCNADFGSSYLGGDKAEYDALNSYPRKVVDGTAEAWLRAQAIAGAGVGDAAGYAALAEFVDLTNFADYMLLNFYGGNSDWDDHNWYSLRRRVDGAGWRFVSWDAERVLESPTGANRTGIGQSNKPSFLYANLRANPDFRLRFADRVYRHCFHDGVLTPGSAAARYRALADWVFPAIACESARWGDNKHEPARTRDNEWLSERNRLLNDYFPRRTDVLLGFLRQAGLYPSLDAPEFLVDGTPQHGGHADRGARLALTGAGEILYTLDGTDPYVPVTVIERREEVLVPENAPKRVWVPTADLGTNWRDDPDFDDGDWLASDPAGPVGVGYERSSGYESFIGVDLLEAMSGKRTSCYVRIPFTLSDDQLNGLNRLTLKVRYDDGFVAYLNGTEIARANAPGSLTWNAAASSQHSDSAAVVPEAIDVSQALAALHSRDNLLAVQALNISTSSSDLLLTVSLEAGEVVTAGQDLAPGTQVYSAPIPLTESLQLKARVRQGAAWSALHEAVFAVGPVVESLRITELMYHPADTNDPADPNREYLELTNLGAESLNLKGVRFTAGIDFTFGDYVLAPGAACLLVRDAAAFAATYGPDRPVAGVYTGRLDDAGETLECVDAAGALIQRVTYRDDWYPLTDGAGYALVARDPAGTDPAAFSRPEAWQASAWAGGSPGRDDRDALPVPGTIVINEVLANAPGADLDWIELHNRGAVPVDLGGWFLSDDPDRPAKYEIAAGTVLDPAAFLVLDEDDFNRAGAPGVHRAFALSARGETVVLRSGRAGVPTGYESVQAFPASVPGRSLGRVDTTGGADFVALRAATPGTPNAGPVVGPVVVNEIFYRAPGDGDVEYVELINITDQAVSLVDPVSGIGWRFVDDPGSPGIELRFPAAPALTLAPGQVLVLTLDETALRSAYAVPVDALVLSWGSGRLGNGGDRPTLQRPGEVDGDGDPAWIPVDRIAYSDGSHGSDFPGGLDPWPVAADGLGAALQRIEITAHGNDPANWIDAAPTPGQ